MSIRIMSAVWERQDITPTQKLVLLALADWANDDGLCWPSINRLVEKTGMSDRSIQRLIRQLEELGLVKRDEAAGKGNKYWILIPPTECHPRHSVTPPPTECHPTPDTVSPNTSYIHQDTSDNLSETDVSDDGDERLNPNHIFEYWNETAGQYSLKKIRDLTPERRKLLQSRISQYALDDFVTVFNNIKTSGFLKGETGFKGCTFDWVFKKANFQKILEGNYNG